MFFLLSRKPCGHVKSLEKKLGGRGEGKRAIFEFRSKTIHGTLVMHPPPPTAIVMTFTISSIRNGERHHDSGRVPHGFNILSQINFIST